MLVLPIAKQTVAAAEDTVGWSAGLSFHIIRQALSGSVYFYGSGNDADILVEVASITEAAVALELSGWELNLGYDGKLSDGTWFTARKGLVNLIVMQVGTALYDKWLLARAVCMYLAKRGTLQVHDKEARATIHAVILDECLITEEGAVLDE